MSRDDRTNIFKCIIKKKGKPFVVYIVKWMQGDPDYWTDEMFIKIMTGQKYTYSLNRAVQIAHIIDARVGGSEYEVTLVERYSNVVLCGDSVLRDDAHKPFLSYQSNIFEQFVQSYHSHKKKTTTKLYYSIYGNCYVLYVLDGNKYNLDDSMLGNMADFNPQLTPFTKNGLPTLVPATKTLINPNINTSIISQIKKNMIYNIQILEKELANARLKLEALE